MRSATAPPRMPDRKAGSDANAPVSPAWVALPVVVRTNHGIAIIVSDEPISETQLATSNATIGSLVRAASAGTSTVQQSLTMDEDRGTAASVDEDGCFAWLYLASANVIDHGAHGLAGVDGIKKDGFGSGQQADRIVARLCRDRVVFADVTMDIGDIGRGQTDV